MKKVLHVAVREFLATVATKGFILGILVVPLIMSIMLVGFKTLLKNTSPKIEGDVAIIDPTGEVAPDVRDYLSPEKIAQRRQEKARKIEEATPKAVKAVAQNTPQGKLAMEQAMQSALGDVPILKVVTLDPKTDLEQAKTPLKKEPGGRVGPQGLLALAVIHPDTTVKAAGKNDFGTYDLFVRKKLDDRLENLIKNGLEHAIVGARIRASGLERQMVESLTRVDEVQSKTVTERGEQTTNEAFNFLLPMGFMILMWVSVLSSGQYLLTSTVEEKSNRVVEVLLSAVSPMQLMVGKIIGQMAVGFLILALYAGLGIVALVSFAMLGLLDVKLLFFLLVFFVLAYFTIAAFMAAIGSAVNEMREAQTLMTPVMLMIMIPWVLWMPITRDPNSTFATVTSFIPPISNFVMLLRLTSTSPPPMWQAFLSIAVGAVGVYAALWFAAKVFKIGLLMFGKPPSLGTLIKWARMS